MRTDRAGFTLVELMIVILLLAMVLTAASSVFVGLMTSSGVQGRIVESSESMVGLDMLRRDIEEAGIGLPDSDLVSYKEFAANTFGLNDAPNGIPRMMVSSDSAVYAAPNDLFNGSDYLVVRSSKVARNRASQKWTYLRQGNVAKEWAPQQDNIDNNASVVVIWPRASDGVRSLVTTTAAAYTIYQTSGVDHLLNDKFAPVDPNATYIVYGIDDADLPVRPFNRADYYIAIPPDMPDRCAPNTGILYKTTMNHDDPVTMAMPQPLVDCVADMQVVFGLDNDNDGDFEPGVAGSTDGYSSAINMLTAQQIRSRVKEVRVYILTHEGQEDRNYTHPIANITVGEFGLGRVVNIGANVNYRWKVYQLSIQSLEWTFGKTSS